MDGNLEYKGNPNWESHQLSDVGEYVRQRLSPHDSPPPLAQIDRRTHQEILAASRWFPFTKQEQLAFKSSLFFEQNKKKYIAFANVNGELYYTLHHDTPELPKDVSLNGSIVNMFKISEKKGKTTLLSMKKVGDIWAIQMTDEEAHASLKSFFGENKDVSPLAFDETVAKKKNGKVSEEDGSKDYRKAA